MGGKGLVACLAHRIPGRLLARCNPYRAWFVVSDKGGTMAEATQGGYQQAHCGGQLPLPEQSNP